MKTPFITLLVAGLVMSGFAAGLTYPIVGTGQHQCYDNFSVIAAPSYRDNGDGTVSDLVTGLMWFKGRGVKVSWEEALAGAKACRMGGHNDWRVPTIKELYSLIQFTGECRATTGSKPFLDTNYFGFVYGNPSHGERMIDCQDWSSTKYISTTMIGNATVFGVNFADGRIKGYPIIDPRTRSPHKLYVRYVRGNPAYGKNHPGCL